MLKNISDFSVSKEDFFPNPKSKPSIYRFSWKGRLLILLGSISWSCRLEKQQITLICPWQIRIDTPRKWCVCDGVCLFVCVVRVSACCLCLCVCVRVCACVCIKARKREREDKVGQGLFLKFSKFFHRKPCLVSAC